MHPAFKLLDEAIVMGRQELAHLAAGDVDKAEALAFGRDGVLAEALSDAALAAPAEDSLDTLVAKLTELKELQAQIIDEASRLRQDVGAQIRDLGQEEKRHKGYGRAVRPTPLIRSRFISKNS
jgi:hypothetical protein